MEEIKLTQRPEIILDEKNKIDALWVKILAAKGDELATMEDDLLLVMRYWKDNMMYDPIVDPLVEKLETIKYCLFKFFYDNLRHVPSDPSAFTYDLKFYQDRINQLLNITSYPYFYLKKYVEMHIPLAFKEAKNVLIEYHQINEEVLAEIWHPSVDQILNQPSLDEAGLSEERLLRPTAAQVHRVLNFVILMNNILPSPQASQFLDRGYQALNLLGWELAPTQELRDYLKYYAKNIGGVE